jgi:TPR repeat protein
MIKPALILAVLPGLMLSSAYGQDFEITKQAAEKGDAAAQVNLGNMYQDGKGVQEKRGRGEKGPE